MKFSLEWLKQHLDTNASAQEIADELTAIGLEVEEVSNPGDALAPFRVAKGLTAEKNPQADKQAGGTLPIRGLDGDHVAPGMELRGDIEGRDPCGIDGHVALANPRMLAASTMPVPSGLVKIKASPRRRPALRRMREGSASPVTAKPRAASVASAAVVRA